MKHSSEIAILSVIVALWLFWSDILGAGWDTSFYGIPTPSFLTWTYQIPPLLVNITDTIGTVALIMLIIISNKHHRGREHDKSHTYD